MAAMAEPWWGQGMAHSSMVAVIMGAYCVGGSRFLQDCPIATNMYHHNNG